MAELYAFPGVIKPDASLSLQPVAGVIEELELLLADARSGVLRAVAVATVRNGDYTGSVWCRPPNGDCGHSLGAAIGYLQHRYCAQMVDASRPREQTDPA